MLTEMPEPVDGSAVAAAAAAAAAAAVSAHQPGSPAPALPLALGAVSPFRFHFVACLHPARCHQRYAGEKGKCE